MKKLLMMILAVILAAAPALGAFAEGSGNPLADLGAFFTQAADDVAKWAESTADEVNKWADSAAEDVTKWAESAWQDASKWAEGAWQDASKWAEGAWGDASRWLQQAWQDSSLWAEGAWKDVTEALNAAGDEAEKNVREEYVRLLKELDLNDGEIKKVMGALETYAKSKGLPVLTVEKLALPYLLAVKGNEDFMKELKGNSQMGTLVAARLTGLLDQLGIKNDAEAQELLRILEETLNKPAE